MNAYPMVRTYTKEMVPGVSVQCTRMRWDAPNTTAIVADSPPFDVSITQALQVNIEYAEANDMTTTLRLCGSGRLVGYTLEFFPNNPELGAEFTLEGSE
jgi:hypothetical protein